MPFWWSFWRSRSIRRLWQSGGKPDWTGEALKLWEASPAFVCRSRECTGMSLRVSADLPNFYRKSKKSLLFLGRCAMLKPTSYVTMSSARIQRETGASPVRSRRCNGEPCARCHCILGCEKTRRAKNQSQKTCSWPEMFAQFLRAMEIGRFLCPFDRGSGPFGDCESSPLFVWSGLLPFQDRM